MQLAQTLAATLVQLDRAGSSLQIPPATAAAARHSSRPPSIRFRLRKRERALSESNQLRFVTDQPCGRVAGFPAEGARRLARTRLLDRATQLLSLCQVPPGLQAVEGTLRATEECRIAEQPPGGRRSIRIESLAAAGSLCQARLWAREHRSESDRGEHPPDEARCEELAAHRPSQGGLAFRGHLLRRRHVSAFEDRSAGVSDVGAAEACCGNQSNRHCPAAARLCAPASIILPTQHQLI